MDGIDLRVERGEIFGVLGPNGAGKTTTMKMLSTLLEPTEGTARILGYDVVREARDVRRRMGAVLSDGRSLYWKLTARENLEYFAALYHVPPKEQKARIESALQAVKLDDRADDYVERYSTGMRQRLVLARALLPDPELLLLDEPTVGLDPQSSRDLRDRVRDLKAQGRTVLLTTHYMEEADQLCDRIAIVDHGQVVALDTPTGLKRTIAATEVVHLEIESSAGRRRVARPIGAHRRRAGAPGAPERDAAGHRPRAQRPRLRAGRLRRRPRGERRHQARRGRAGDARGRLHLAHRPGAARMTASPVTASAGTPSRFDDLRADLRAFGAAGMKEWRLLRRYPTLFVGFMFWPIALPLAYVFQAQGYSGGQPAALDAFAQRTGTAEVAGFLFLGWATYMWISMILWGPGTALRTEQVRGSLEALFMTPVSRLVILFGPVVSQIVWAVWMFAVVGGALVVFFRRAHRPTRGAARAGRDPGGGAGAVRPGRAVRGRGAALRRGERAWCRRCAASSPSSAA